MSHLLDTNILVRWANQHDSQHTLLTASLISLRRQSERLYISRQNIIEFWAVATRPKEVNGLAWTIAETRNVVDEFSAFFDVLPNDDSIYSIWLRLVEKNGITGTRVHDARIASTAIYHGVTHLLTINVDDFRRFTELTVVHPKDVPLVS